MSAEFGEIARNFGGICPQFRRNYPDSAFICTAHENTISAELKIVGNCIPQPFMVSAINDDRKLYQFNAETDLNPI